ncbi:MAG TPA: hypothetical protein VH206_02600 [Xanthobacteraceae bacterium]|jgi:hypothetical protein|nr:hypothetical protein [Xanthobacteraceae bacterium]
MADYYPLITRAVEGLGTSTGEGRRSLYERARAALVAQLRGIDPPLSEADITRERLALEDAIRKVEAEAVRKARSEPRVAPPMRPAVPAKPAVPPPPPPLRREPLPPRPDMGPPPPPPLSQPAAAPPSPPPGSPPSARSLLLKARTSTGPREGVKGFRDVVNDADDLGAASAKSARSARDTRDSYGAGPSQPFADDEPDERAEPRFNPEQSDILGEEIADTETPETIHQFEDEAMPPAFSRPQAQRQREPEERYREPRPPRSYRGLAKLAVVLIILAGLVATISWQWSNISGLYSYVTHMRSRQAQTTPTPTAEPKFPGRVPQEQAGGQAPGTAPSAQNQAGPAVAQRVVLYEEDPNDPNGKRYAGSAVWRTETVSPGTGLAPELQIRADITVPDKKLTVSFTLRRNTDQALPASHTIEVMFNLPPDFAGGGIANVPGVLMKESEQARGTPLAGLAVKVTNGFFLIGLSAVDADVQRNMQLLKDRPWFDIPIVYTNGGRAILAMEKGPPGDRAFADAFAAWGK